MNISPLIENIKKTVLQKDSYNQYVIQSSEQLLALFAQHFGLEKLDEQTTNALIKEITQTNATTKQLIKERLSFFFPQLLQKDFVWNTQEEHFLNHNPTEIAANIFAGYWTILSYANNAQNLIPQDEKLKNKFAFWLKKSKLYRANLEYQDLSGIILTMAHLPKANFSFANLTGASLAYTQMPMADFSGATLQNAQMSDAQFIKAKFVGANLSQANLRGSNLQGSEIYGANFQQVDAGEINLTQAMGKNSSFKGANLSMANLSLADFSYADMSHTNLTRANFAHTNLVGTLFTEANLYESDFSYTSLQGSDLRANNFIKAKFYNANLEITVKEYIQNKGALL